MWPAWLLAGSVAVAFYNPPSKREFSRTLSRAQSGAFWASQRARAAAFYASLAVGGLAARAASSRGLAGPVESAVIIAGTAYVGYHAWPWRPPMMVGVLESKEQAALWSAAYGSLKAQYHAAFLLGVAGAALLARP